MGRVKKWLRRPQRPQVLTADEFLRAATEAGIDVMYDGPALLEMARRYGWII